MSKIAIVTQSYKNDFKECRLLCESMDKFAPEIDHFIFVNDEDYEMFQSLAYGKHHIFRKSTVLPKYLVRVPFKFMGHHFHVSPFTIPVREWIIQQICKLGVFEVIGDQYDATFNIDSETLFMRPFVQSEWEKDGKFLLYRKKNIDEPSHDEYVRSAKKLLKLPQSLEEIGYWNYMNTPVAFARENTKLLLDRVGKSVVGGWKRALCNTYRFSEYYTYGIFTDLELHLKNHFVIDYHIFPQIDISECSSKDDFKAKAIEAMKGEHAMGLWLQKKDRKALADKYLAFDEIEETVKSLWP